MAVAMYETTKTKFRVFNNMVLMEIYGTKREEVTGDIWTVQVITFVLEQGSVYMIELY
jgi:hypothetical protein